MSYCHLEMSDCYQHFRGLCPYSSIDSEQIAGFFTRIIIIFDDNFFQVKHDWTFTLHKLYGMDTITFSSSEFTIKITGSNISLDCKVAGDYSCVLPRHFVALDWIFLLRNHTHSLYVICVCVFLMLGVTSSMSCHKILCKFSGMNVQHRNDSKKYMELLSPWFIQYIIFRDLMGLLLVI